MDPSLVGYASRVGFIRQPNHHQQRATDEGTTETTHPRTEQQNVNLRPHATPVSHSVNSHLVVPILWHSLQQPFAVAAAAVQEKDENDFKVHWWIHHELQFNCHNSFSSHFILLLVIVMHSSLVLLASAHTHQVQSQYPGPRPLVLAILNLVIIVDRCSDGDDDDPGCC